MGANVTLTIDHGEAEQLLHLLQQADPRGVAVIAKLLQQAFEDERSVDEALTTGSAEKITQLASTIQPGFQRFRLLSWLHEREHGKV